MALMLPPWLPGTRVTAVKVTSGTAAGQGWLLLSQSGETAARGRIRPCQGTGFSLHSMWVETALLLSARYFTTQKNEAWKSVMLSSSLSAERSRNQERESC